MKRSIVAIAVAVQLGMLPAPVAAQQWPTEPVKIVVPFAAGGASDLLGRLFAQALSVRLGQQFYVENRPGGGGGVAAEAVARSKPDGYTLLVSGMPPLVVTPAISKNVNYDPIKDFTHIAYFGGPPNAFVAHPSAGVKNYQEFVAAARTATTPLEYVSPGLGSSGNMVAEYFAAKEGLKFQHIAYRGGGPAMVDLLAGRVKFGSMTLSTTGEHIRSGALVPIAISSAERQPAFPNIPTLKELGRTDLVTTSWFSLSGPPNMPADVAQKINKGINESMQDPAVRSRLEQQFVEAKPMTPDEFTRFVQDEVNKWAPVLKSMGN